MRFNKVVAFCTCITMVYGSYLSSLPSDSLAQQTSKDFTAVAKSAIPAVVSIQVKSSGKSSGFQFDSDEENPFGDELFRFFFSPKGQSQTPRASVGQASGFIIKPDGYVLTNSHVVQDASEIKVILNDGREFVGKLVGNDSNTDVALVKIDAKDLPYLQLGNSDDVEIGQWDIAIGTPFGLQATLTVGVVSAKGRNNLELANIEDFIQTDAAINRGNSGGPLLNLDGKVIGMNTAIVSNSGSGYMGIGFAIPSNILKHITEQLISGGAVTRGFIGVTLQNVDQDLAHAFGLKQVGGAVIADLSKGSPAEIAGVKQGDIIQFYNKIPVTNIAMLRNAIALMSPGSKIVLSILRNGSPLEIPIVIGAYPANSPQTALSNKNKFGFEVQAMTKEQTQSLGGEEGVVISKIEAGSPAAWAGLKKGAIILGVNQKKISSVEQFNTLIRETAASKPVLFLIKQGDSMRFVSIRAE